MLQLVFILFGFLLKGNFAYDTFYMTFESHSCNLPPHPLNPLTSEMIIASYEGGPIGCDYMTFVNLNDPDLVTFELLINPLYHEDPDCALTLLYRTSLISEELEEFNCTHLAENRYSVQMGKNSTFYLQIVPLIFTLENVRFKVKLMPTGATFSTEDLIAILSGGSIGAFLILSFVGFGICMFRKKRKDKK